MNNINIFELSSTFEAAYGGGTLAYPNTSFVKETNQLQLLFSKPKWVDLGLPSGIKWASCNVGATKPEEYGLYFAWGETEGYIGENIAADKKAFIWDDYKWCNGSETTLTKYNVKSSNGTVDNLTTLELADDAAYLSDNTCRMPTRADFQELTANTTSIWETLNGVNCRRFTSKTNGNSILVPAAGGCGNDSVFNESHDGYLWSSSLYSSNPKHAYYLIFNHNTASVNYNVRYGGFPVRPVKD